MKKRTALWMGLLVGAFGTTAFADAQKVIDVQTVQGWIARKHANWRAKDSWVTKLSKDEVHRMLGVQRPPRGRLEFEGMHTFAEDGATSVDWRNMNGVDWLGPVMNQGNCGSCVAFATVATLEAQTSISAGVPWLHPTYSPQALFACGGGSCDFGWMPDMAADYLKNTGIPDEACLPYTSGSTGQDVDCKATCSDSGSRTVKIASYTTPSSGSGSVEQVKAALKKGPLVTTLGVYMDFLLYAGGVYKHVTGEMAGGHAVSLIGYDDAKRAWLIRNSWGPEWGENGFAWVSWDDESGVGSETWGFDMGNEQGFLSVTSPSDKEFVSGKYQLSANSKGLTAGDVKFQLVDASKKMTTLACAGTADGGCAAQLDTTQLKEGRYEVYAESGSVKSQVREFYVINSEPTMSLTLAPVDGVDLTKPLHDRPEFNITAKFSPVPIEHLEFRVYDMNGKLASYKTNDYVLEQMRMGWRTINVADGQYKILVHGETKYNGKVYSADSNAFTITVKN